MFFKKKRPTLPITEDDQLWLDRNFRWLMHNSGLKNFDEIELCIPFDKSLPVILPNDQKSFDYLLSRLCRILKIDENIIEVEWFKTNNALENKYPDAKPRQSQNELGTYQYSTKTGKKFKISLNESQKADFVLFVGTLVHELCHIKLIGEKRINAYDNDHEYLTDLTAVYFGFGIFLANAAFQNKRYHWGEWKIEKQGYLTPETIGYALALFTYLKKIKKPVWSRKIDSVTRRYFKRSLRYLWHYEPDFSKPASRFKGHLTEKDKTTEELNKLRHELAEMHYDKIKNGDIFVSRSERRRRKREKKKRK